LEISERVRDFITTNLLSFEDEITIQDDDNIFQVGFLDSSVALLLVTFVEEEFNVQVTDDDLDLANFSTINGLVQFINRKKGN
jgi:acyl carrier protein